MHDRIWTAVDEFAAGLFLGHDEVLESTLRASADAGLPAIQVSPCHGMMLCLIAKAVGAQRILEIGTLGGYSAICLGRGLPPGGRLITLEADPRHAKVARANLARAGLEGVVEVRIGRALQTLPQLATENAGPFDLTFIDADKEHIAEYFDWAVRLSRPGSMILVDNVVREGALLEAQSIDPAVRGVRRFLEQAARDTRISATVIQTVGVKKYDGFAMAVVGAGCAK